MDTRTRQVILEKAAAELVRSSGRRLTLRQLAADAGTSTQAIYTLFGGKQGLILALYEEGWSRLVARLEQLPATSHPLRQLYRVGLCYLAFARENEHFYALMIGRAVGSVAVPSREIRHAEPWGRVTRKAIEDAIAAAYLAGPAEDIGQLLWATAHGFIDLTSNSFIQAESDTAFLRQAATGVFAAFAGPKFDVRELHKDFWDE